MIFVAILDWIYEFSPDTITKKNFSHNVGLNNINKRVQKDQTDTIISLSFFSFFCAPMTTFDFRKYHREDHNIPTP